MQALDELELNRMSTICSGKFKIKDSCQCSGTDGHNSCHYNEEFIKVGAIKMCKFETKNQCD